MSDMKHDTRGPRLISMWSGPRNISTALMRAWENRTDTRVVDEPFYACYLARTHRDHPGRAQVLAAQPTRWREVVAGLLGAEDRGIVYHKQMSHHLDDAVSLDWLDRFDNCFLIREPRAMLASLLKVLPDAGVEDTGLPQQLRLFEHVSARRGTRPPVIDSADVLRDPEGMLRRLCAVLGVAFAPQMLSWPPGPRDSDGVWAPHWYAAVERSTGFAAYRPTRPSIPAGKGAVLEQCKALYASLYDHRLERA